MARTLSAEVERVCSAKARQSLDLGLGMLLMGAVFASPGVGAIASRGAETVLSLVGLRYGGVRLS